MLKAPVATPTPNHLSTEIDVAESTPAVAVPLAATVEAKTLAAANALAREPAGAASVRDERRSARASGLELESRKRSGPFVG
jgi:hypothetical protein